MAHAISVLRTYMHRLTDDDRVAAAEKLVAAEEFDSEDHITSEEHRRIDERVVAAKKLGDDLERAAVFETSTPWYQSGIFHRESSVMALTFVLVIGWGAAFWFDKLEMAYAWGAAASIAIGHWFSRR